MARRNGFVDSVKASFASRGVAGFRSRTTIENGKTKDRAHEVVKASLKRESRFRMKPVSHSEQVG